MLSQFSGAVLDKDRKHRFLLWRFWDDRPRVLFIGLNSSTAHELTNDPTVNRWISFSQSWGYGGFYACNLSSQVTPHPEELLPETWNHRANIPAIRMALGLTVLTVCCWGDGINQVPDGKARVAEIFGLLEGPMCFGLTASGNPKHPLYLPGDTDLVEFEYV